MIETANETEQALPAHVDRWSRLDFEETPAQETVPSADPVTVQEEITNHSSEPDLDPILFDDEDSVDIEVTDRPFQKKPLPKITLGLIGAGLGAVAVGTFITAGSNDASKVFSDNASTTQEETAASNIPGKDPRDQKIGELQSDQASSTLKSKIDALNKRKEQEAKLKASKGRSTTVASVPASVVPAYSSLPVASAPDPVPFRSIPDPKPVPYIQPERSTPVSQNYEPQREPQQQPKLLAFGGIPEDRDGDRGGSTTAAAQPVSGSAQSSVYTPVSYRSQSQGFDNQGFATQGNGLEDQQRAFLGGDRQARISANASASGTVSSGAILPGRFSVQINSPLSGIPAGSIIIFETKTVYSSGKVEAYGIGVTSGDYQRLQPIPVGAIALFSSNGNLLKAQRPSAGFFGSAVGRSLMGAFQGAAGRYLSTDSTISQSDSGTLLSQKAGGKGMSDLAAGALQGGLSPLLQSLPQRQQGAEDKNFSVEPGKKVMVKVLQPFTFSF